MDLAAVAVPAGFTPARLPFGVSLIAPAWSDADLLALAARLQRACVSTLGATSLPLPAAEPCAGAGADLVDVMVCGAHMSGLPLNKQLLERGAWQISTTRTAPIYRFYALPGGPPFRPGLVQVNEGGVAIDVEVWRMPVEHFGSFVAGIPAPLGIGKVKLEDGSAVSGFLCESLGVAGRRRHQRARRLAAVPAHPAIGRSVRRCVAIARCSCISRPRASVSASAARRRWSHVCSAHMRPALADVGFQQVDARNLEQQNRHEYRARETPPCTGGEPEQAEAPPRATLAKVVRMARVAPQPRVENMPARVRPRLETRELPVGERFEQDAEEIRPIAAASSKPKPVALVMSP